MGFMDKAKDAALQAKAKADQARQQGQAKVTEMKLYRSLGEAVYAEQRKGGSHASVETALAALDAHFARSGTDGTGAAPPATDVPPAGAPPGDIPPPGAPPADVPPGG